MDADVSSLSIVFMVVSLAGSVAIPVALAVYFRKKYRCDIPPFFIGCAVMLLFAFVLEQIAHGVILSAFPGLPDQRFGFALYAGLMAGLFEETGRFVAFHTVMKPFYKNDHNAWMYGAGHGGFEAMVILGITMLNNLIFTFLINSGNADRILGMALNEEQGAPYVFLLGLVERVAAILLHLSFSVLVWMAVRKKKPRWFVLAIALHTLVDAVTVLMSAAGMHPVMLEGIIILMAAAIFFFTRKLISPAQTEAAV